MDIETNDELYPELQRQEALNHARRISAGVVTVTDGVSTRTYANTWVAAGKEVIIDLTKDAMIPE